jgi:hypothetical protein
MRTIAAAAHMVDQKGDAPTTARLSTAPTNTVVHASKGLCCPNERLPEIRTSTSAMTNTTQALAAICQKARSDPSPNTNSINDCIVPPRP